MTKDLEGSASGIVRNGTPDQIPRGDTSGSKASRVRAYFIALWKLYVSALTGSWHTARKAGWKLFVVMLVFYSIMTVIMYPLISWLFREALRANGMVALDFGAMTIGRGFVLSALLLIVLGLLAFWIASIQFVFLVLVLQRAREGMPVSIRSIWADAKRIITKLFRPASWPLALYLFVLLPLSGFGFVDAMASRIAVPKFISGELMKDPTTALAWQTFMAVLVLANIKFALSLPTFALTNATGAQAMRLSWRLTGVRASIALVGAALTIVGGAAIATGALIGVSVLPTLASDALTPSASPIVAAFSLGIAEVIAALLVAFVTALIVALMVEVFARRANLLPESVSRVKLHDLDVPRFSSRNAGQLIAGVAILAAIGLGFSSIAPMKQMAEHPSTLILAHRGYVAGGVENTIEALEAAAEAGADMVEMDVMQTADGEFVVIHDPTLSRLAGKNLRIKDLTLEEATAITVSDHAGHSQNIPSLEEYVLRAAELEMPLLIEIKLGGLDSDDMVERLISQLESLGAMDGNIFHSLDPKSVEKMKTLRPDATVGYIMPFAGGGVPNTPADFIVVEEWTATQSMQAAAKAASMGFFVWTVDEENAQREKLRRGVDGIITDKPVQALASRESMDQQTGFARTLVDVLRSFVVF